MSLTIFAGLRVPDIFKMIESVRFLMCGAQMAHNDPDCVFNVHRDHLYHTYAGDLKPSKNISLVAHMVKS